MQQACDEAVPAAEVAESLGARAQVLRNGPGMRWSAPSASKTASENKRSNAEAVENRCSQVIERIPNSRVAPYSARQTYGSAESVLHQHMVQAAAIAVKRRLALEHPDDEYPRDVEYREEEQPGHGGETVRRLLPRADPAEVKEPDPQRRQQKADEQGPGIAHENIAG